MPSIRRVLSLPDVAWLQQNQAKRRKIDTKPSKSGQTQALILAAASRILIERGYNDFTLRKVASEAGVSIGNLNYHYPTKSDLVDALLDYETERIFAGFDEVLAQAGSGTEDKLRAVLNYWIDDLQSIETTVFFPEIWSLANHHDFARKTMLRTYSHALQILLDLIAPINPNLSPSEVERIGKYMCASMEGLTPFVGHKRIWSEDHERLKQMAIESFLQLIRNGKSKAVADY